jgi:hypothetical protein
MTPQIYVNRDGVPKLKSGEWAWVVEEHGRDPFQIAFGCPCDNNCGGGNVVHNSYIAVSRENTNDPHQWNWDGNWDEPTLTPSIQRRGVCNWHGYLRQGKFTHDLAIKGI